MALDRWIRNTAVRIAFLTDSRFQQEDRASGGRLKKRALRVIERNLRHAVIEDSFRPDAIFYIIRSGSGKQWCLRRKKDEHRRGSQSQAQGARA